MEDFTKKKKKIINKNIEKSTTIIYSFNTAYTVVVELTELKKKYSRNFYKHWKGMKKKFIRKTIAWCGNFPFFLIFVHRTQNISYQFPMESMV